MRATDAARPGFSMTEANQDRLVGDVSAEKSVSIADLLTYQETVFLICLGFSRNTAEAEDLAQDAYLKACRKLAGLREPRQAKEWLCRIARNVCLDHQKKTRIRSLALRRLAREAVPSSAPEVTDEISDHRITWLKSAAAGLPKKLRDVFVLREYGHLTYEELSATLGLNKGTVMSRLNRARRKVAAVIQEYSHE